MFNKSPATVSEICTHTRIQMHDEKSFKASKYVLLAFDRLHYSKYSDLSPNIRSE